MQTGPADPTSRGVPGRGVSLLALLLALTLGPASPTRAEAAEPEPGVAALADQLMAALRQRDPEDYQALHASYLESCSDPQTQSAYAHLLAQEARAGLAADPGLRISPVDADRLQEQTQILSSGSGEVVRYPLSPRYFIDLALSDGYPEGHACGSGATRRVRKPVARTPDGWVLAPPCLPSSGITAIERHMQDSDAVRRMQDDLEAALPASLRTELLEALRNEGVPSAIRIYREATKASGGAAARLIQRLCDEL